jgi:uncharacterized membrane protein
MTLDNHSEHGLEMAPIFTAVLTPHRSLGQLGFVLLMAGVGLISFFAGIIFLMMGAWPVFGFFGLDVLLLYWAFKLNYRSAAAFEEITVTPVELRVRKVSHRGRVREWSLNPLWVRLEKITLEEFGIQTLLLVSRGKQLQVGAFLGPNEKADFASELSRALAQARRGPTVTVIP